MKNTRTVSGKKKPYSLELLAEKVKSAKKAKGLADGTIWLYQHAFNLLGEFLQSDDVRKLNIDVCRDFATWLLNDRIKFDGHKYKKEADKTRGLSPRTANDVIKPLRTAFRFYLQKN